jgi:hypothetical protein
MNNFSFAEFIEAFECDDPGNALHARDLARPIWCANNRCENRRRLVAWKESGARITALESCAQLGKKK